MRGERATRKVTVVKRERAWNPSEVAMIVRATQTAVSPSPDRKILALYGTHSREKIAEAVGNDNFDYLATTGLDNNPEIGFSPF